MLVKAEPEFRILAYPTSAIATRGSTPFGIADVISHLIKHDIGEGKAANNSNGESANNWEAQPLFQAEDDNLAYVVVNAPGANGPVVATGAAAAGQPGVGGFVTRGRVTPVNCRMNDWDGDIDPDPVEELETVVFRTQRGDSWKTIRTSEKPPRTRVFHTAQTANTHVSLISETLLEANQEIEIDLDELAVAFGQNDPARIRIAFGGGAYSLLLRQGAPATVDKRDRSSSRTPWRVWRELTSLPTIDFQSASKLQIRRIGGFMAVGINGVHTCLMEMTKYLIGEEARYERKECRWAAGPLEITFYGVSATLGLSLIEMPVKTSYSRTIPRQATGLPVGSKLYPKGWIPPGTKVKCALTVGRTEVHYTVTLYSDPKHKTSPLLTGVTAQLAGGFVTPTALPLDITRAFESGEESGAEPGVANSAEWTMQFSRFLLDKLPLPEDAPEGATWEYYLTENGYNPISFEVRDTYNDGTKSEWVKRLDGFVRSIRKGGEEYNADEVNVTATDGLIRYDRPAGVLDETAAPQDYLLAQNEGRAVYAADCVKELVRTRISEFEASQFNGNGDARRFMVDGHPPLLSYDNDVVGMWNATPPPKTNGFILAPPSWFDSTLLDWIRKYCDDDGGSAGLMVFFYAFVGTARAVPVYGDIDLILTMLASENQYHIAGAEYSEGDLDTLMSGWEFSTVPEKDFNTVAVLNHFYEGKNTFNSYEWQQFVAKARLDPSDPRAPEHSWDRLDVVETNRPFDRSWTAWLAYFLIRHHEKPPRPGQLRFRGERRMQWGDVIKPKQLKRLVDGSDLPDPVANFDWYRVMRLTNRYAQGRSQGRSMESNATVIPLTEFEKSMIGLA
jgi:hypothetical protein